MPNNKKHWPLLNIEDVGDGSFIDDKEVFLGSIAISLKRIADIQAVGLVELPLKHGGAAHIRPSQVASVSVHGQYLGMAFVQMIGDTGEAGFAVTLSVGEVTERLGAKQCKP